MIRETPVEFGDQQGLSGIVVEPSGSLQDVAMIFLSAGIVHRVGPNRHYVSLSRSLAAHGIPSLRFDFSGVGESEAARKGAGHAERVLSEARAAMDFLEGRLGVKKVALFGICSGADNGLSIARLEPRVVGAVLAELYSADSASFSRRRKLIRALYARTWSRVWRDPALIGTGLTRFWSGPGGSPEGMDAPEAEGGRDEQLGWNAVVRDIRDICRTRRLLLVYSRHDVSHHNFRKLLSPHLVGVPALAVTVIDGTNHTFGPLEAAERLAKITVDWMRELVAHEAVPASRASARPVRAMGK